MRDIKLIAYRNPSRRAIEFYMRERFPNGKVAIAEPVVMTEIESELVEADPFFTIDEDAMQNFLDELWSAGFRPSGVSDVQMTAQGRHLEDMRKIAFMFLEKRE